MRSTTAVIVVLFLLSGFAHTEQFHGSPLQHAAIPARSPHGNATGPVKRLRVDITWPREDAHAVYVLRPFEVRITALDESGQPVDTTLRIRLSARFPGEFEAATHGYFAFPFDLQGTASITLTANFARAEGAPEQRLMAYCDDFPDIFGESDAFSVFPHAPAAFALITPQSDELFGINLVGNHYRMTFSWEPDDSGDAYRRMRQSIHDTTRFTDSIRYTLVITDPARHTESRYVSDDGGRSAKRTLVEEELVDLFLRLCFSFSGSGCQQVEGYWHVEATDGVYCTRSTHADRRFKMFIYSRDDVDPVDIPVEFVIESCVPNPFTTLTVINVQALQSRDIQVTVHDQLGKLIRVLHEGELSPGRHAIPFDAADCPSGVYHIRAVSAVAVRTMGIMHVR